MPTSRLSAAVALAFVSSVPFSAFAEAPAVTWRAPLNGATISRTISGSACAIDATASVGMQRVVFWIGGMQVNNDYSSPWNCSLDTTRVRDGAYTMRVDAYSARGELTQRTINVTVNNSGTTTSEPAPAPAPAPAPTEPTTALPAPTAGSLDVWFKAPLSGNTVSGVLSGETCYVKGTGVSRVNFAVDGRALNSDTNVADGMSCTLDTRTLTNGTHQLTATAVDAAGATRSDVISVNVQNTATTTPTTPTNTAPTVAITAPLAGQSITGTTLAYAASATDNAGVSRVEFRLNGNVINNDTAAPYGGSIAAPAAGTHTLTARAYDAAGLSTLSTVSFTVGATTTPTSPTAPTTSNLPNGGSAVATFHSLGLYFRPSSNPGTAGCRVQYRRTTETAWRQGLNMWYDTRNSECRGSVVNLQPGTQYEVQFGNASTFTHKVVASTWAEQFPIARTVTLPAGTVTQPLAITEGGSASGYVLYQAHPNGTTIDVRNAYASNVTVNAPYVIVRGLTLRGAQRDAVDLQRNAHHVVVEANDISGWGRRNYVNSAGWEIGVDMDSAIRARCGSASAINTAMNTFVIQRNRIHDPRYGANSWDWGHPAGPQGVTFSYCGGNHVIRYNDFRSADSRHYLNDAISGEDNFTNTGFPHSDSDIYGNSIQGVMDDAIEAEGGNRNVRIWGNYLHQTGTGIASTVVSTGPLYIFRNVYNQSRKRYLNSLDTDDRGPFFKAGSLNSTTGGGRRYVFHNTALQATGSGATSGLGAGLGLAGNTGQALTNTVSRNNIFHIWKGTWPSISQTSGGNGNDVNYDLYNGNLDLTGEANGVRGTPVYASGHGPASGAGGNYQLAPTSPGYGRGLRINNFNDDVAAPDMGAHQSGRPAMRFGIQ